MFCMILQTLDLENGIPGLHKGKIRHQKELTLTGDHASAQVATSVASQHSLT